VEKGGKRCGKTVGKVSSHYNEIFANSGPRKQPENSLESRQDVGSLVPKAICV